MISNTKTIYLWDYEYCRLLGSIELEEGMEPTNVAFINGYGVLVISTTNCMILFVHFEIKEQNIEFKVIATINLKSHDKKEDSEEEEEQILEKNKIRSSLVLRGSKFFNREKSVFTNLEELQQSPTIQEDENSEEYKEKLEKKISNTANKLLIDMENDKDSEEPVKCRLLLGLLHGVIRIYNIFGIFTENKLELYPHANKRMNYNAFRGAKEDFNSAIKKVKNSSFILNSQKIRLKFNKDILANFQAHKEQLTTLVIITLSDKRILSSSLDCFIKIWSLKGEKLAAMNINHPLPIIWDIKLDKIKRTRKNILFALKIVELIFRRYKRAILLSEEKNLNVNNFLSFLSNKAPKSPVGLKLPYLQKPIEESASNLVLLRQVYSPRDLHYDHVKHIYQREVMGPSLKEMEINKQLQIAQKIWKSERENSEDNARFFARDYLIKKYEEKAYKEKDALLFFQNEFREKLNFTKGYDDYPENVQKFSKKLEVSIKKKKVNNFSVLSDQKNIGVKSNNRISSKKVKTVNLPSLNRPETIEMFDKGEYLKFNRSRINENSSSLLNDHKQTFLEYASAKNLLDSTTISKLPNRNSQSLTINNTSNMNLNGGSSNNFKKILKNLDRNLKKSMNILPKMNLPRRQSDMLINLLDNSNPDSFLKPKSSQKKKKINKRADFKKNIMFINEDDSNVNTQQSQNEIDIMLADILKNVQEKVKKKLEIELLMRKKEWEIETKRQIMMEFRHKDTILREEILKETDEQKIIKEDGGGMGFGSLGLVFQTIKKN